MLDVAYPKRILDKLQGKLSSNDLVILDLGCGNRKLRGAIGVEIFEGHGIDVVHNLNEMPYPFATASADVIILRHVIEHLQDVTKTIQECARILKPGGTLIALTPHFSDVNSWIDPTHHWHLATRSLEEASKGALTLELTYIKLRKFWRRLGLEYWINNNPFQTRVPKRVVKWENDWCYLIRGGEMLCLLKK